MNSVFQALAEAARAGEPVALGVISGVKGSSPQKIGAKALFYRDGRIKGTLGGGCLEAEIQQRAIQSLRTGHSAAFDLLLDHDFGWDDGLICGGKVRGLILPNAQNQGEQFWSDLDARRARLTWGVKADYSIGLIDPGEGSKEQGAGSGEKAGCSTGLAHPAESEPGAVDPGRLPGSEWLYRETIAPPCLFWIAGAGHIAQAVAPLALQLDFAVTVFDDRPALANNQFFPPGVHLKADIWERLLAVPLPDSPAFGLIVTRGHRHDALVLKDWIHKPFRFLGMIGSSRKARTISQHFIEERIATAEELERVACPVGLPIRARTVQEIAVSILAQFIDKRAELVREESWGA